MGKLFGRKRRYSDEEYENEELDDEFEEDEEEDDEELEDDEDDEDDEELEDDEDDEDDEELEDDEDDEENEELEDEEDESEYDEDGDELEDEEDYEEDEDERRAFRHRRRVRNQIIAYSVVFVFLLLVFAGCVSIGRIIVGAVKTKKQAEEQEKLQAQMEAAQAAQEAHAVVIDTPETLEEESTEASEEDYLREIMEGYLSEMPLEDKVAGLFMVRPETITGVSTVTKAGDGTREALNEYAVGGLIYFEKNILDKEQITTMLGNTVSMSRYPIFLGVDEEGGSVSRVAQSSIDVAKVGDMTTIGESGDTTQAYEAGTTIGAYLKELGFNLDFAPVADVADSANGELGDRVFGSDAQAVGAMVSSVVEGIEGVGVSACLKYFPGIGNVEGDTHDGRVETTRTLEEMRNADFPSFKAGIEAGVDFVMVSHVTASAVEEDSVPSSLSKTIITDLLRNELGFQGVIITDALDMNAITQYYTSEEAAVMAIEAGADMLLMPEDFQAAYDGLLEAVREGTISEERINESLERIYRVKSRWKMIQMQKD